MAKNGAVPPAIMGSYLFIEPIYHLSPIKGTEFFDAVMLLLFRTHAEKVGEMYKSIYGTEESPLVQFSRIFGDYVFLCPTRSVVATMSEGTQKDVGCMYGISLCSSMGLASAVFAMINHVMEQNSHLCLVLQVNGANAFLRMT